MEVKINREIRNYTESIFFGLSLRQFFFSVLACGVAVGLYFLIAPIYGNGKHKLDVRAWCGAFRRDGILPISWDECRTICVGMDQIGNPDA